MSCSTIDHTYTSGDTSPGIRATLKSEATGLPITGLSGATVTFKMNDRENVTVIEEDATIESVANAVVYYQFGLTDLDNAGEYRFRFIVDFGDDIIESYPPKDGILLEVQEF